MSWAVAASEGPSPEGLLGAVNGVLARGVRVVDAPQEFSANIRAVRSRVRNEWGVAWRQLSGLEAQSVMDSPSGWRTGSGDGEWG